MHVKENIADRCPECGQKELRPDVTQGVTDCVNCGWSVSWLEEVSEEKVHAARQLSGSGGVDKV